MLKARGRRRRRKQSRGRPWWLRPTTLALLTWFSFISEIVVPTVSRLQVAATRHVVTEAEALAKLSRDVDAGHAAGLAFLAATETDLRDVIDGYLAEGGA